MGLLIRYVIEPRRTELVHQTLTWPPQLEIHQTNRPNDLSHSQDFATVSNVPLLAFSVGGRQGTFKMAVPRRRSARLSANQQQVMFGQLASKTSSSHSVECKYLFRLGANNL